MMASSFEPEDALTTLERKKILTPELKRHVEELQRDYPHDFVQGPSTLRSLPVFFLSFELRYHLDPAIQLVFTNASKKIAVDVKVLSPLRCNLTFKEEYPGAPDLQLSAAWLSPSSTTRLKTEFLKKWRASENRNGLKEAVDWLQHEALKFLGILEQKKIDLDFYETEDVGFTLGPKRASSAQKHILAYGELGFDIDYSHDFAPVLDQKAKTMMIDSDLLTGKLSRWNRYIRECGRLQPVPGYTGATTSFSPNTIDKILYSGPYSDVKSGSKIRLERTELHEIVTVWGVNVPKMRQNRDPRRRDYWSPPPSPKSTADMSYNVESGSIGVFSLKDGRFVSMWVSHSSTGELVRFSKGCVATSLYDILRLGLTEFQRECLKIKLLDIGNLKGLLVRLFGADSSTTSLILDFLGFTDEDHVWKERGSEAEDLDEDEEEYIDFDLESKTTKPENTREEAKSQEDPAKKETAPTSREDQKDSGAAEDNDYEETETMQATPHMTVTVVKRRSGRGRKLVWRRIDQSQDHSRHEQADYGEYGDDYGRERRSRSKARRSQSRSRSRSRTRSQSRSKSRTRSKSRGPGSRQQAPAWIWKKKEDAIEEQIHEEQDE